MFDHLLELDRSLTLALNGSDSIILDEFMWLVTSTIVWIPMGLFLLYYVYRKMGIKTMLILLGGILLCVFFADLLSSGICKPLVARLRPSKEPTLYGIIDLVDNYQGGWYGFFSSHAANTMSIAVFLSLLIKRSSIVVLLVTWSLINSWSRLYLGVHYVGDVLVGLIWGVIVGWLVWLVMRKYLGRLIHIDSRPVEVVILLTYAVIIVLSPILASLQIYFR